MYPCMTIPEHCWPKPDRATLPGQQPTPARPAFQALCGARNACLSRSILFCKSISASLRPDTHENAVQGAAEHQTESS